MQMKGQGGRVVGALALHYLLYTFLGVMGLGALFHFHNMADNTTSTGTSGSANLPDGLNVTLPKGIDQMYLSMAEEDAANYNYNSILFVRQIYRESTFNPNAPISSTGDAGIAQFQPGTAPCWGIRVDNIQDGALPYRWGSCVGYSQNTLPPCSSAGQYNKNSSYQCDERYDPVLSLDAAAHMVSTAYRDYLGSGTSAQDQIEAYKKALAAYNCGGGCVDARIQQYGVDWEQHLPDTTKKYISYIMYGP